MIEKGGKGSGNFGHGGRPGQIGGSGSGGGEVHAITTDKIANDLVKKGYSKHNEGLIDGKVDGVSFYRKEFRTEDESVRAWKVFNVRHAYNSFIHSSQQISPQSSMPDVKNHIHEVGIKENVSKKELHMENIYGYTVEEILETEIVKEHKNELAVEFLTSDSVNDLTSEMKVIVDKAYIELETKGSKG